MEKMLILAFFAVLFGMVVYPPFSREQIDERETASDSTGTFESFSEFYKSLPDSVKQLIEEKELYQNMKNCYEKKIGELGMPIFIPDSSLTASMPILKTPPVDEEMIIPGFRGCQENGRGR